MPDAPTAELDAAGRTVALSNPDKVFFPERGETKLDLARYYVAVEEPLMRALGGRPILMERYPEGAGGPSFFQKRVPKNAPDWLQTTTVQTPNGTPSQALVAADLAHLIWAVNLGCLGFHVWPYLAADPEHADELRIDLDPSPGVSLAMVQEAARRGARAARRARAWPRIRRPPAATASTCTCGCSPSTTAIGVRAAAVALARELERRRPDLVTAAWWKEERGTRVFVDFNQNAPHKTVFGAWTVRPRPGGQVSTPFRWEELEQLDPARPDAGHRARPGGRDGRSVAGDGRVAAVARAAARAARPGHAGRLDGRPLAAGVPEDAERAAAGRAQQGTEDLSRRAGPFPAGGGGATTTSTPRPPDDQLSAARRRLPRALVISSSRYRSA